MKVRVSLSLSLSLSFSLSLSLSLSSSLFTFSGKIKPNTELASYSLEAALYCKKAQCEMKMSTEEKQRRVV